MEALIEQCTSEKNTHDKWDLILRVCEEYASKEPKACLKVIGKRLFNKNPNVSLRAITLLDACSKNCGKPFNREIASRDFVQLIKGRFSSLQRIPSVKLAEVFEKWAEEFQTDSELALAAGLYSWVRTEHNDVIRHLHEDRQAIKAGAARQNAAYLQAKEEEELAKALAISLKESEAKRSLLSDSNAARSAQSTATASAAPVTKTYLTENKTNLYPNFSDSVPVKTTFTPAQSRVRALYDFEAAEDNELTFKAGELIVLLDDSDENWWRGSNHRGEGLFPAQFVKRETEETTVPQTDHVPNVATPTTEPPAQVRLDGNKLDECLHLISMVDPTGEFRPDPPELPQLEAECNAMAPLVDPELEKVDKRLLMLSDLNQRLLDAFQLYHDLMSQSNAPVSGTGYYSGAGAFGMSGTNGIYMPSGMGSYANEPPTGLCAGVSTTIGSSGLQPGPSSYALPENFYSTNQAITTTHYAQASTQPGGSHAYYPVTQAEHASHPLPQRYHQIQQPYAMSDVYPAPYTTTQPTGSVRPESADPTPSDITSGYAPAPETVSGPSMMAVPHNAYQYYGYGQNLDATQPDPGRHNTNTAMAASGSHPVG
ncbi:hypothetical protein EG68_05773 [Paragonimus skrjabini miyazakii]|uniref:Signal transducing adapter molecule 1 n=1 Tax=Paragonimus skrjabini miyazakii TaxID=59628 RepID=A0A8S9YVF6_9TREM|nr:hypothetical protein EG68_05773 [Paragonimus skrjabini miyazakii]